MNFAAAVETFLSSLLPLVAVTPLVLVAMRGESRPNRLHLLGLSVLVLLSTNLATCADFIFSIDSNGLYWNWLGKTSCMAVIGLWLMILPAEALQISGIFRLPQRRAALPILVLATLCALMGAAAGPANGQVGIETLAYQAIMPSLAEEPVFRGILPALLAGALGSPWKLAGARLGWWWPVCALLFSAGHWLRWTPSGPELHMFPLVGTAIGLLFDLLFGWLAARCGSVWPCVICHSLINATGVAIALLGGSGNVGEISF